MIKDYSFGKVTVFNKTWHNDILISWDGYIKEWWRKKGHRADISDIQDILCKKPEIIIIGKGKPGLLKTTPSLQTYLRENHITLIELKTSKAIDSYNHLLLEKKKVAAGFHLTC